VQLKGLSARQQHQKWRNTQLFSVSTICRVRIFCSAVLSFDTRLHMHDKLHAYCSHFRWDPAERPECSAPTTLLSKDTLRDRLHPPARDLDTMMRTRWPGASMGSL
jgi:hypothetical protein